MKTLASLGFVVCSLCSACSSTSSSSGAADAARAADAAGAEDAASATDAAVSCQPVATVCSGDAGAIGGGTFTYHCVTTWSAAQQRATWCSNPGASIYPLPDCGGFDIVEDINVDVSYAYYYDRQTGTLVGIGFNDPQGKLHCIAGSVVPVDISTCHWTPQSTSLCFLTDAGAD
jgi:hypothetical protein